MKAWFGLACVTSIKVVFIPLYKVFSRDVMAFMLVFPSNRPGIELCSYVLLFWMKNMLIDHVSENTLSEASTLLFPKHVSV